MIATRANYLAVIADLERQRDGLTALIEHLMHRCPSAAAADVVATPQAPAEESAAGDAETAAAPSTVSTSSTITVPAAIDQVVTFDERLETLRASRATKEPDAQPAPAPKKSPRGSHQSGTYQPARDEQILATLADGDKSAADVTRAVHGRDAVTKAQTSLVWTALQRLVRDGKVTTSKAAEGKRYQRAATSPIVDAEIVQPAEPPAAAPVRTTTATGVALRQPTAPKKQVVAKGDESSWWLKTKPGEMTATAEQHRERMAASRESRQVSGSIVV